MSPTSGASTACLLVLHTPEQTIIEAYVNQDLAYKAAAHKIIWWFNGSVPEKVAELVNTKKYKRALKAWNTEIKLQNISNTEMYVRSRVLVSMVPDILTVDATRTVDNTPKPPKPKAWSPDTDEDEPVEDSLEPLDFTED